MKALYRHTSPETAYMVSDYPYGRDRCRIRFWLESDDKRGFRFCSQTEHPKRLVWNAPKKSTYSLLGGCMFLNEANHCTWEGVTEYSGVELVRDFIAKFPESDLDRLQAWCAQKAAYTLGRSQGKHRWTIGGVVKEDTPEQVAELVAEAAAWKECFHTITQLLKGRVQS